MLIKGEKLNEKQRQEVLNAYIYRHLDTTSKSDEEWLKKHGFHFLKDGTRLAANHKFCVPDWFAD